METKTLFFLRHAQSVYNEIGIIQGELDSPLSKKGKKDTKLVAPLFSKFGFKNIARSPLARAKQTAEIVNEELNLPIAVYENLKEFDFGKWQSEMKFENWDEFRTDFYQHGMAPPGGESKHELFKRAQEAVISICNEIDEDPILVVTHGMLMRILIGGWFTNNTEKELREIKEPNLAMYKVEFLYDSQEVRPKEYEFIDLFSL